MLLGASSALADQPRQSRQSCKACEVFCSSTSRLHGAELYVLSEDGESILNPASNLIENRTLPVIQVGAEIPCHGPLAEVIHKQKPVLSGPVAGRCQNTLTWLLMQPKSVGRSTYLFPVSTAQKRYGILPHQSNRARYFFRKM